MFRNLSAAKREDMRIDRIDVYYVELPLIYPWRTAYGEDAAIDSVLVRMVSGQHVGWGESTPRNDLPQATTLTNTGPVHVTQLPQAALARVQLLR